MTFIHISNSIIPPEIVVQTIEPYEPSKCNMFNKTQPKKNKTLKRKLNHK